MAIVKTASGIVKGFERQPQILVNGGKANTGRVSDLLVRPAFKTLQVEDVPCPRWERPRMFRKMLEFCPRKDVLLNGRLFSFIKKDSCRSFSNKVMPTLRPQSINGEVMRRAQQVPADIGYRDIGRSMLEPQKEILRDVFRYFS
ncbi:MAG: hypothetical protein AAF709_10450 [Pseudomonadota bacterium]